MKKRRMDLTSPEKGLAVVKRRRMDLTSPQKGLAVVKRRLNAELF
ncbi:hypothetical protein J31TS3_06260 [Paenibacillus lactis]|nr:hypothetical protein J31TS3_06260 [Paenibacillus lactis]